MPAEVCDICGGRGGDMESKTKNYLTDATIKHIFENAKITGVSEIAPLGAGEFNAVYLVKAIGKEYVLKVAPTENFLPYERDMMAAEVYWYKRMREDTSIRVPEVYFYDDSKQIISSEYFIMEKIEGEQLDKIKLSREEKEAADNEICKMAAKMHSVKGEKFGYIQMGLHDDWYQAIRAMTVSLIESCEAKGHKTARGHKLLKYIDKHADILKKADCRMVNFDIWAPNIIVRRSSCGLSYSWIDPERCFWGDRIADFMCLHLMKNSMYGKKDAVAAYNSVANEPIAVNDEINIRYAISMAYGGLIMETEKYYRYSPLHLGWWRNVFADAFVFYKTGFAILKRAK